ncbi:MAG: AMP-binding protein [Acidimicrobiia bacterium]
MNLADLLLAPAAASPDAVAVRHGAAALSYADLGDAAARFAGRLQAEGVSPGDRVAMEAINEPAFVVAYLGALRAGAVAVPLNPQAPEPERDRELAAVEPAIVLRRDDLRAGPGDATPAEAVDRADDDLAVLLFTAGTAGHPKAPMLTHGNLTANIRQVQDHPGLRLRPDDVALGVLPVFHVFGLNVSLGVTLTAGAALVLVDEFHAAPTLRIVREHTVTVVAGVPAMYAAWEALSETDAHPDAFASVRLAVSGAAALHPRVAVGFRERFGISVYEGYGLTEAAPIVTTSALGSGQPREGSIGPPLPGVEVRLVDVDGADVLAGDPGEIWVRGPNVFSGYWRDEEATARALTDEGWLRTGDIAVIDDDGELRLVDRSKDLIIVSGFNVYPAEVEDVLREHPDVAEAAVVGEPNDRTGEAVAAFVVPRPGRAPTAPDLIAHCARLLARYKCPERVEVVDSLPRSFAGKVLRRELRGHA